MSDNVSDNKIYGSKSWLVAGGGGLVGVCAVLDVCKGWHTLLAEEEHVWPGIPPPCRALSLGK